MGHCRKKLWGNSELTRHNNVKWEKKKEKKKLPVRDRWLLKAELKYVTAKFFFFQIWGMLCNRMTKPLCYLLYICCCLKNLKHFLDQDVFDNSIKSPSKTRVHSIKQRSLTCGPQTKRGPLHSLIQPMNGLEKISCGPHYWSNWRKLRLK